MKKLSKKALEKMVSKAFYEVSYGIQIPMMELGKVFRAGEAVALAGGTHEEIKVAIASVVDLIRVPQ